MADRGIAARGGSCARRWRSSTSIWACACQASFEHEFQLLDEAPPALPFSLEAQRRAEPFAGELMGALLDAGVQPEFLTPEFAAHQFEIPVAPAEGLGAPIAASCSRRSCARSPAGMSCARASHR